VTELLKRCPQTSHPIAQDCFKLLGGMLRQCERWQPSTGQLRFLVTWAFGDLEESAGRQNAFHLLKVRWQLDYFGWVAFQWQSVMAGCRGRGQLVGSG
jgi:hypothetical protein